MGKAVKVTLSLPPDDKGNVDTALIVESAIAAGVEMRSWAAAAYKRGLFYQTLRNDKMTWADMVCTLPGGRQLITELKAKYLESFVPDERYL